MRRKYEDEPPTKDGARYGNRKVFDTDRKHAFNNAIEMLELAQDMQGNPNKDIISSFRLIGVSIVFIMLATLPPFSCSSVSTPYSVIGLTFGLIGTSAIVGCLFVLNDTIIHAELKRVNISVILMMIAHYGLLFEYLLDSPAAEYFFILLRTLTLTLFFGSLTSVFAKNGYLFSSPVKQLCARAPAFLTCYVLIIQLVSIGMHYSGLEPYLGSELTISFSGILGMITGLCIVVVFSRVPHWVHQGFRQFHAILRFFHTLIHKKSDWGSRLG